MFSKDKHDGALLKGEALLRLAKRTATGDCFYSFSTDGNQQVDRQHLSTSLYVANALRRSVHACQHRQTMRLALRYYL